MNEVKISKSDTVGDLQRLIQVSLNITDPESFHLRVRGGARGGAKGAVGKTMKNASVLKLTNLASGGEVFLGEGR